MVCDNLSPFCNCFQCWTCSFSLDMTHSLYNLVHIIYAELNLNEGLCQFRILLMMISLGKSLYAELMNQFFSDELARKGLCANWQKVAIQCMRLEPLFKDSEQRLVDFDIFSAIKHTDLQNKELRMILHAFYFIGAKLVAICDLDQGQGKDLDGQEFTMPPELWKFCVQLLQN